MSKNYFKFSKKHFEYGLRNILITNQIGFLTEITDEWVDEGNVSNEYIYKITTKNPAVDVIVFSSISINTNKARNIGNGAVRFVLRWKTKNGYVFKRIAKHYRVKTLFDNIKPTIIEIQKNVFNLNYGEFYNTVASY